MNSEKTFSKLASPVSNKKLLKEQGNIKPDELYRIITFDNGSPDRVAIDLYTDIRSWYKPKKTTEKNGNVVYLSKLKSRFFKTSYRYLAEKYHASKETIRLKLVKLEDLGLLNRVFTSEKRYYDREENNILNILVWQDTPHFQSSVGLEKTKEFSDLCHRRTDHKELPPSPNEIGDIYSITNNSSNNFKADISDKESVSDFFENPEKKEAMQNNESLSEQDAEDLPLIKPPPLPPEPAILAKSMSNVTEPSNPRTLAEWTSEIGQEEADIINSNVDMGNFSGKEQFNLGFTHKLMVKLSKPNKVFSHKKAVINYLTKAFSAEKRSAFEVNAPDFRFWTAEERAQHRDLNVSPADKIRKFLMPRTLEMVIEEMKRNGGNSFYAY